MHEFENSEKRLNVRSFAQRYNYARSTVNDALKRLMSKELIEKPYYGIYVITSKGKKYLESVGLFKDDRKGGRDELGKLNFHKIEYKASIIGGNPELLRENSESFKVRKMKNWCQYDIKLKNATIRIGTKTATIYVHEIEDEDLDVCKERSNDIALSCIKMLNKANYTVHKLEFSSAHWARVSSVYGEMIEKKLGKYKLSFSDGTSFWIDHSEGPVEDETDNEEFRRRLDSFQSDLLNTDSNLSDIDTLRELLKDNVEQIGILIRSQQVTTQQISFLLPPKNKLTIDPKLAHTDYIG